jgi:hypothetical protein
MLAMRAMSAATRAETAFAADDADISFGEKYLELLYANWAQIASTLRRTVTLLVVLVVGFLLLNHTKSAEFTLGPLRLTNIASVLILVPAIVSFLGYEFLALQAAQNRYEEVSQEVVRVLHKPVRDTDLDVLLQPPTASLWGENGWFDVRDSEPGLVSKLLEWSGLTIAYSLLFVALAFLVYAYVALYENSHANTVAVTISALFSVFNGLRAALIFVDNS